MVAPDQTSLVEAGRTRWPLTVAVLLVAAIGVSILKPWADAGSGAPRASATAPGDRRAVPPPAASAGPAMSGESGTPSQDPISNISGACYYGLAWRLFTTDTTSNGLVHTWYGLQPIPAVRPADPTIPVIEVHSQTLQELGYCPKSLPNGQALALETHAWKLLEGEAPRPLELHASTRTALAKTDRGTIYMPPSAGPGAAPAVWASGIYIFQVTIESLSSTEEWFAVRIG